MSLPNMLLAYHPFDVTSQTKMRLRAYSPTSLQSHRPSAAQLNGFDLSTRKTFPNHRSSSASLTPASRVNSSSLSIDTRSCHSHGEFCETAVLSVRLLPWAFLAMQTLLSSLSSSLRWQLAQSLCDSTLGGSNVSASVLMTTASYPPWSVLSQIARL